MEATNLPFVQNDKGTLTFGIGANDPWPSILEQLELLRESDLTNFPNLEFCIWPEAPVAEVFEFLVETFECCSNKGYPWGRLVFQDYDVYDHTHLAVLQAACQNSLFQYLWISPVSARGFRETAERMNEETAHALKDAMVVNEGMVEICMFMQLSEEAFGILGDGLKQTKSLETLSLHLGWSRQHDDRFVPPLRFIQGLKENQSLKTLELDGFPEEIWPENILKGLMDHPTLKTLSLKKCCWGESSVAALGSLLSSSACGLSTLDLSYPDLATTHQHLPSNGLAKAMKANQSIEMLRLRYCGLDYSSFSKLWTQLSCWQRLVDVDLTGNRIESLSPVRSKVARLRRLDLSHNPILSLETPDKRQQRQQQNTSGGLAKFLQAHPELQCLGQRFSKSKCYSLKLQHLLDINASGRILFCNGIWSEPSLWPRVLERANEKFEEHPYRRANVIYSVVHGLSASL